MLKTPMLAFDEPAPFDITTLDAASFQTVTSDNMAGAQRYCWLHPGDSFAYGALVYSFGKEDGTKHEQDCVFAVAGPGLARQNSMDRAKKKTPFPKALAPFNIVPTTELLDLVTLDLEKRVYCLDLSSSKLPPQVDCLKSLYAEEVEDDDADPSEGLRLSSGRSPRPGFKHQAQAKLEGPVSEPHSITGDTLQRRRQRIPEEATHFVWAYQLSQWFTDKLDTEQLNTFKMYSGEISLASYGGLIFLNADRTGDDGRVLSGTVVGVNALTLRVGDSPAFQQGVTDRANEDQAVTPHVASPELFDGVNIGIETDIYSFGIIMWEVMTRQIAWHWVQGDPGHVIMNWVGAMQTRPKIPAGLSAHCAEMIRKCLHVDPNKRPSAQEILRWLHRKREHLQRHMAAAKKMKIAELRADNTKRKQRRMNIEHESCRIADNGPHWYRGQFSPHSTRFSETVSGADRRFELTVVEETWNDWLENAQGQQERPTPEEQLQAMKLKPKPFGLVFTNAKTKESEWPVVTRIDKSDKKTKTKTLASQFTAIKAGCTLTEINGHAVPTAFNDAKAELKARPLHLEFTAPMQPTMNVTPRHADRKGNPRLWAAVRGGLRGVGMVEAHEKRQAVQSRAHKNLDALQQKWQAAQAVADAFKRQLEEARAEVVRESEPEPELGVMEGEPPGQAGSRWAEPRT
eukprot:COSAG04_NODE_1347_length_7134_cov_4.146695_2_plen_684_part_00